MREKKKKMKKNKKKKRISSLFPLPQMMRPRLFQKGNKKKLQVRGKFQKKRKVRTHMMILLVMRKSGFQQRRSSLSNKEKVLGLLQKGSVLLLVQMMTPPHTPSVSLNNQLLFHQNLMHHLHHTFHHHLHLFLVQHHQPPHLTNQVLVSLILLIPQFLPILSLINCRFFSLKFTPSKMKCASFCITLRSVCTNRDSSQCQA